MKIKRWMLNGQHNVECDDEEEKEDVCVHEWHKRLGHRNIDDIKYMSRFGLRVKPCKCDVFCESCIVGKMSRKKFDKRADVTENVLDVIVSDVCGWMQEESLDKKRYFMTLIDDKSKYCEVRFLQNKSDVANETKNYIEWLKTQFGKKPKTFRSDRGLEYLGGELQRYLEKEGIRAECTVGYCPNRMGWPSVKIGL